ncbi:MAG: hypothetical protein WA510_27470 [Acidobacteriaceae bacterium]
MMRSRQNVDDQVLTDYLFGDLPAAETDRLDELSIVDDDFAARLHSLETDLVDAYVRGELSGTTLTKFEKVYLSSAARRERVAFAQQLKLRVPQGASRLATAKPARSSWMNLLHFPQLAFAGGFAMLLLVGLLLFENLHPRANQTASNRAPSQPSDIARPPDAKPASEAPQPNTPAANVAPHVPSLPVTVFAFVLAPQMRGAAQIPRLELPQATTRVDFRLELENNDFPRYRVALKSLQSEKTLWQSAALAPATKGNSSALSVRIPATLLQRGMYQLDLTGVPASGEAEFAGSYAFRIEPR